MKELLLSIAAISAENRTIKAEPFSGKQEDYPKWRLKQKQLFISANMAHVLEPSFLGKLPSTETCKLNEATPAGRDHAKYRRQNAKAAAVLIAAQDSEDVILAIQEANSMELPWPSGTAPDMWKALEDIFQPDDGMADMQMEEDLHALKFTKKEEPKQLALRIAKISMRCKKPLSDLKKASHIMRLGKAHYADVLCAEERACHR